MTGSELRKSFIDYFGKNGHKVMKSFPLVPEDKSVLFTIAGMLPFKPIFTGEKIVDYTRATTSQKCIRTNDIENVGRTTRHHTFFEMLGNFSFGDYFKEDAIAWAWDYTVNKLGLDKSRMYLSVYKDDEEAAGIWKRVSGLPEERIVRFGEESNFWNMGPTGPCGPCSEIIYDMGKDRGCQKPGCNVTCSCDRFLEVWNLVFTQYNRNEDGSLTPLPKKNIDTGMGLERLAAIVQGVDENFRTDFLYPLIKFVENHSSLRYCSDRESDMALRVLADHLRASAFLIADGVVPSNEDRGYVLRRIIRRAARFVKKSNIPSPFLYSGISEVVKIYKDEYPELGAKKEHIANIVRMEEEKFIKALDGGMEILNGIIKDTLARGEKVIKGKDAFTLFDRWGLPFDITLDAVREKNLDADRQAFDALMEEQKNRSRQAWAGYDIDASLSEAAKNAIKETKLTSFTGYDSLEQTGTALLLLKEGGIAEELKENQEGALVSDSTPFYAESGGQTGDTGKLEFEGGSAIVTDTKKIFDKHVHIIKVKKGRLAAGAKITFKVDPERRREIMSNHTATHLLQKALRDILGEHVAQSGSYVGADKLRFDFNHMIPLRPEEVEAVERLVNRKIMDNDEVSTTVMERSRITSDVMALFEDKYADKVRLVEVPGFSRELCGGTHSKRTGDIGVFKITAENGVSAGIRRIEALTGFRAFDYLYERSVLIDSLSGILKTEPLNVIEKVEALSKEKKKLEKTVEELKFKIVRGSAKETPLGEFDINGIKLFVFKGRDIERKILLGMADEYNKKLQNGIFTAGSAFADHIDWIVYVSDGLNKTFPASALAKKLGAVSGGSGGGRPDMAQAGGKDIPRFDEVVAAIPDMIKEIMEGAK